MLLQLSKSQRRYSTTWEVIGHDTTAQERVRLRVNNLAMKKESRNNSFLHSATPRPSSTTTPLNTSLVIAWDLHREGMSTN